MKKILKVVITFFVVFIIVGCTSKNKEDRILYSWHMKSIYDTNLIKTMKKLDINVLYQDFSTKYLESSDNDFLKEMNKKNITVYHLFGEPSWGLKNSNKIKEEIDKVSNYNKNNKYKISGIVLDIESYTEDDFNKKKYINILKEAYMYAKENNIKYTICIPVWFKDKDLEKLIYNSDEISLMNYNIDKTVSNMKEEVKIAKKYKKKINTIYEIKFNNKKHFSSYEKIENDYKKIRNNYDYPISIAYHHYDSIVIVDKNDN